MKPLKSLSFESSRQQPEILRLKRRFGTAYGLMVGLSFAVSTWGMDGFLLSRAHAFYPWLAFILGAVICMIVAGLAGWLVARLDKAILAPVFYLGVAFVFAWLTINLPFQVFPKLVAWLDPEAGQLLHYTFYEESFASRFVVTMVWISIFITLVGILQIPLVEPAAFSTTYFSKIAPLLVCSVIMLLNGTIVGNLSNEPLRLAVLEMNDTIQFSVDHQGEQVDPALARARHLSSLRAVEDVISQPRQLIVGSYDQWLGQISVLIRFGDTWVDCTVVYSQPSFCKYVTPN
ncbi:MAG: hypothetical protein EHM33_27665 [Chloroflexi bacterium]|nr:MAG: hypothetical protein EHM33_27665 [Chloroflexota bacterium]